MIGRLLGIPQNVASKTNRIIRHRIGREWLVRVVAGDAGNSCVSLHPASAALKAVWCKTDVQDSECYTPAVNHIFPSAMAGPAKIDRLHRIELSRIEDLFDGWFFGGQIHPDYMIGARSMASFASNAGYRIWGIKTIVHG